MAEFAIKLSNTGSTDTYRAGEKLLGTVSCHVARVITNRTLQLCFRGVEKTTVEYEVRVKHGDSYRSEKRWAHGEREFWRISLPPIRGLFQSDDDKKTILPGDYELRFALELPDTLPETWDRFVRDVRQDSGRSDTRDDASVRYELVAELRGNKQSTPLVYGCKKWVDVSKSNASIQGVPQQIAPKPFPVSRCCFSRGSIILGANVDKTQVARGGNISVTVEGINTSSVYVFRITVALMRVFIIKAHGEESVYSRVCSNVELSTKNGPLASFNSGQGNQNREIAKKAREANKYERCCLTSELCTLKVPSTDFPSYKGSLIGVRYHVCITAKTEANDPTIFVPITVF